MECTHSLSLDHRNISSCNKLLWKVMSQHMFLNIILNKKNKRTCKCGGHQGRRNPHIHIARTTPYWLNAPPPKTATHTGEIRNLHTYINNEYWKNGTTLANTQSAYINKWLSND
jgi:hypothetical protein